MSPLRITALLYPVVIGLGYIRDVVKSYSGRSKSKSKSTGLTLIRLVDSARNLGVIFDKILSFAQHISSISKSCFHNICDLRVFVVVLIKLLPAPLLLLSFILKLTIVTLFYSIYLLLSQSSSICPELCCLCCQQNSWISWENQIQGSLSLI